MVGDRSGISSPYDGCSSADAAETTDGLSRRQLLEGAAAAGISAGLLLFAPASAQAEGSSDTSGKNGSADVSESDDSSDEGVSDVLGTTVGVLFFVILFIVYGIIYSGGGRAEEDQGLNDWTDEHDDDRPWSRRG